MTSVRTAVGPYVCLYVRPTCISDMHTPMCMYCTGKAAIPFYITYYIVYVRHINIHSGKIQDGQMKVTHVFDGLHFINRT